MAANTIILKGPLEFRYEEGKAAAAITPGHFVEQTTGGLIQKKASTAGSRKKLAVAIEDALQGKTIDDAYATNDVVRYYLPFAGDKLQVIIKAGTAAIVIGDKLTDNGDGTFRKQSGTEFTFLEADQALDISGGSTDTRINAWVV